MLEGAHLWTGRPVYRRLFEFWLRVFGIAFGLGVVSGIVMAFQFGSNWSELSRRTGPIQGPLLAYESFTAFALEASFFGVLIFGRTRVPKAFYLFACAMVTLGTSLSAFWILINNSWMQVPTGFAVTADGVFEPTDWMEIIFNRVSVIRFGHMLLGAYVTTAFCVAATGAWHSLRRNARPEARAMLRWGLGLAAVLVPAQIFLGHLAGDYVHDRQPAKFAAIEGRWENQAPTREILFAIPDPANQRNRFEIAVPVLGSVIGSMSLTAEQTGILNLPPDQRPPMIIPFFAFRIMVGCGFLMLGLAWLGSFLGLGDRLERKRWLLWAIFLAFPLGFIATLAGWFTAEVGRQPWVVYGLLRTSDAVTPFLTTPTVAISLAVFGAIYALIFTAGTIYIYRLLRAGPRPVPDLVPGETNPKRPLSLPGSAPGISAPSPAAE